MTTTQNDLMVTTCERYTTSGQSSNLRVQAEKGSSAYTLIAAGWVASRLGLALMHLHTQHDAAAFPPGESSQWLPVKLTGMKSVIEELTAQCQRWGRAHHIS